MKIEEYLNTLPTSIMTGEDVELQDNILNEIFEFASLSKNDIFYHLGCGNGHSLSIALEEFGVKKAVGVDNNNEKIASAKKALGDKNLSNWILKCEDVLESDISEATAILFWFSDETIIEKMTQKFATLKKDCRIITIWSPLPGCLPDKVEFPYILNITPFKKSDDLKEQVIAIFETDCIDFVTAWEFAERYSKTISSKDEENIRFLTILQTLVIWINAKNLGIACGNEIPAPIKSYMEILKTYFDIEVEHLLNQNTL
ncbi:MAG: SAM-dependent methyltransferase [Thaumarchaeota archaeon]|nr:SAM-dependent methyltransferase [Nitrososphaerota archaeon]MDE1866689.1 SAM-dependent methyltransferase [Nitrososphaerota archaeon]